MFATKKCLVTGGAGFIGSNIVDALIESGHVVTVVDNLSTGNRVQVNPMAKWVQADLLEERLEAVFAQESFEVVYHLAAQTDVMTSINDPIVDAQVNVIGGLRLLELCRKYGVRKVIYSSSSAVFGEPDYLPVDEEHPIRPLCPYAASKHAFEHYLHLYHEIHDLDYTVLRYANAYGPRQDPHHEGGVVAIFAYKVLTSTRPIINGDGGQTRDFVHVDDLVRANLSCLEHGDNAYYNLGTGIETTINELFALLCELSNIALDVEYAAERRGEMRRLSLASARAAADLEWSPTVDLRAGVRSVLDFFKENENGIV